MPGSRRSRSCLPEAAEAELNTRDGSELAGEPCGAPGLRAVLQARRTSAGRSSSVGTRPVCQHEMRRCLDSRASERDRAAVAHLERIHGHVSSLEHIAEQQEVRALREAARSEQRPVGACSSRLGACASILSFPTRRTPCLRSSVDRRTVRTVRCWSRSAVRHSTAARIVPREPLRVGGRGPTGRGCSVARVCALKEWVERGRRAVPSARAAARQLAHLLFRLVALRCEHLRIVGGASAAPDGLVARHSHAHAALAAL